MNLQQPDCFNWNTTAEIRAAIDTYEHILGIVVCDGRYTHLEARLRREHADLKVQMAIRPLTQPEPNLGECESITDSVDQPSHAGSDGAIPD